ncbi:DNA alkylation repair protein [Dyadobacter beijingensis]|uniref:DNA alkylation repair protein n=1 Tax=Dyadobacter beijingensis TaxID=365489 RepID=A0ABQ2HZB7_9BACT|nr:DNA alkylation repair protein [Dyadobacter beijingensis]GGM95946.1 DNA alkylation repair protein [Dyadobacter beijingensis]
MTANEVLTELESLGNEKVRALNIRNGAGENQFGVKLGDLRTIANRIKLNHELALALWDTGNLDAQLLSLLIIKPKLLSAAEVDTMVRQIGTTQVADWLSSYVIKEHPAKEALRQAWMQTDHPWAARAGWSLTAGRVTREPEGIDIPGLLDRIEAEMPEAAPEIQWTMNTTLAQIGIRFPAFRARALAIGERLGIYRDYPVSKGCTSPFAPIWINEIVRRENQG